ncbi:hypothetical protein PVAND_001056 [Polypedilum vanderplanki]|uniref:Uncharacterized protein n=1 Tax=Polypedilum vanderplanki TaxID=319348 RepID=A0A9J6BM27_POLVA|nr:hypothetical protein PVAND_001056 [Polypedilum vanderplanki]
MKRNICRMQQNIKVETPVAIIKKTSGQKGTLACTIPWGEYQRFKNNLMLSLYVYIGYGWGWIRANIMEGLEVYNSFGTHSAHVETSHSHAYVDTAATIEDITAEDYDYAVDCGDFIF